MKIAVTYDNGNVFGHFGHTEKFKLYDIENGAITHSEIVDTMGQGHGALSEFLSGKNVNVLICGGIGAGAKEALGKVGIQIYGGVSGSADKAVEDYLVGKLNFNPFVKCTHHSEGHSCGESKHGCAGNSCGGDC